MGSKIFDGVRFAAFSNDHPPPHVHGTSEGVRLIVDLLPDGGVAKSNRIDAVSPKNAKRSTVAKILRLALENRTELRILWEKVNGSR